MCLLFRLLLLPIGDTYATYAANIPQHSVDVQQLVSVLQHRYHIRVFYKTEWFEGERFSLALADRGLHEAISTLVAGRDLEVLYLDGVVILLPSDGGFEPPVLVDDRQIMIGQPGEYGRFAHATLSGYIFDGATGEPLVGAVVFELLGNRGASSDINGWFSIRMPVGDHQIRLSYVGYEDAFYSIRLISDGQLRVELFAETSQLEEVTVMARRARENILRTQMSRIELDAVMIRELPHTFGERDVMRSVVMLPGIQTIGELGTGFNVRGGSADQNLILIENVPLFNSSHMFGLISVVNPDLVSDVTLMKAGVPARFGERASSVMDIRLGNGPGVEKTRLTGGIGLINSRLLFQTPLVKDRASLSVAARSSYSDWLLRNIPAEDLMNSHAGFYDLTAHSQISINRNNLITLFGYYGFNRFGFSKNNQHQYASTLFSARWNSYLSDELSSTMVLGWSHYDHAISETPEVNPIAHFLIQSDIDYKTVKWYLTWLPGLNHRVESGLNIMSYGISPGNKKPMGNQSVVIPESINKERAVELSFFIGDDISLNDRLSLDAGLRLTTFLQLGEANVYMYQKDVARSRATIVDSIYYGRGDIVSRYGGLEPRIGFRYQINHGSSVKISYNRIGQYINLVSNTSVMAPSDLWKLSDTYLKPLRSDQFALGYFRNFLDNTIETSAEVYVKLLQDATEYRSGAEIAMNQTIETDLLHVRGENRGLELYARKNSGRLTGWASYTWAKSVRRTTGLYADQQINRNNWFPSDYDRPHNLVLNMNYHISRRWRFGATFTYSTGRPVTLPEAVYLYDNNYLIYYSDRNKYRLPDYHRLDISISMGENHRLYQRGKGQWTVTIMNLYGRKNPFSVYYKRDAQSLGSGRSFNLYQMYIIGVPFPTITYLFSI